MLVGPKSNPANLEPSSDDVLAMFNKIVTCGNADIAVSECFAVYIDGTKAWVCRSHLRHARPLGSFLASTKVRPTSKNRNSLLPLVRYAFHHISPASSIGRPID
jgi:hypothetical protein